MLGGVALYVSNDDISLDKAVNGTYTVITLINSKCFYNLITFAFYFTLIMLRSF